MHRLAWERKTRSTFIFASVTNILHQLTDWLLVMSFLLSIIPLSLLLGLSYSALVSLLVEFSMLMKDLIFHENTLIAHWRLGYTYTDNNKKRRNIKASFGELIKSLSQVLQAGCYSNSESHFSLHSFTQAGQEERKKRERLQCQQQANWVTQS